MNKRFGLTALVLLLILCISQPLWTCTKLMVARDGRVLVGQNWDWKNLNAKIWFDPPEKGAYGGFFHSMRVGYPMGGMNERGLTIAAALSPTIKVRKEKNKKNIDTPMETILFIKKIYRTCATVDEALAVLKKHNLNFLHRAHLLIADPSGKSVIVEADPNGNPILYYRDREIRMERAPGTGEWVTAAPRPLPGHFPAGADYQVITNFLHSQRELKSRIGGFPCRRYKSTSAALAGGGDVSADLIGSILQEAHLEGEYPTKLSSIYDLKKMEVHLYYLHDYGKKITFNLKQEFAKGFHSYDLRSLFNLRLHPWFLLSAVLLLSALLVGPMAFLLKRFRVLKPAPETDKANRKLSFIFLLAASLNALLLLFILYEYPYIVTRGFEVVKHRLDVLFAPYYEYAYYGALLSTSFLLVLTPSLWRKKLWSLPGRVHMALVTAVSAGVIWIMI